MRAGLVLLLLAAAALAEDVEETSRRYLAQEQDAFSHYNRKDYAKAVAAFERQIAIWADNPRPYYNIACCYALEGDAPRAGTWLQISIERGWRDANHLAEDPDFDRVRQSPDYIASLAKLKRARVLDPDPMPQMLPLASVPPTPSIPVAIQESQEEEKLVRSMRVLYDGHEFRKRLFRVLDRRMAVLGRYIVENGDALDAADAAMARLLTAVLYLYEAEGSGEPDRDLRATAAAYVLQTVEEVLRGYPGDPRLREALLARVVALEALGRGAEAVPLLRTIRADHASAAARAEIELCALLPAGDELKQLFQGLKARAERDEDLANLVRARLMRARLLCDGMPDILDLDAGAAERVGAHEGTVAYVFVAYSDSESEQVLKGMPEATAKFLPVVVCIDGMEDGELYAWLKEHGRSFPAIAHGAEAIDRVWLRDVPTVVIARKDGTVVAIDPDEAELARLAGG